MKLCLGALGIAIGLSCMTGCGPGMSHHGQFAKAPVGVASLTSEEMQLPTSRMPVAREWEDPWADEPEADPKLQTWGSAPKPEDRYGF